MSKRITMRRPLGDGDANYLALYLAVVHNLSVDKAIQMMGLPGLDGKTQQEPKRKELNPPNSSLIIHAHLNGDSISKIANRYGVTYYEIDEALAAHYGTGKPKKARNK